MGNVTALVAMPIEATAT